ncbi:MAG: SDR family NAD(P)-dependent oxidoreductase [Alphaproteobacteria bacterium]|nr:SDR family NAD(P)-dependent oxidoreductase [Alphaproteobacteria bacterium]
MAETALIVGVGSGLSASLARLFTKEGMTVALAARNTDKLGPLVKETGARAYACDASDPASVTTLYEQVDKDLGGLDVAVYNASARARGPVAELDVEAVRNAIMVSCYGGFLVAQGAAQRMLKRGHGTILLTGASASVKGYAQSSSFAMGKFGLRGLAQSMARELAPKNIHVAHFVIDGGILQGPSDGRANARGPDGMLSPDAIADTYLHIHRQHRSAWTWEVELRPWVENF